MKEPENDKSKNALTSSSTMTLKLSIGQEVRGAIGAMNILGILRSAQEDNLDNFLTLAVNIKL